MIDILYSLAKRSYERTDHFWKVVYKACKLFLNIIYPIMAFLKKESGVDPTGKIIVSFTSFPERINLAWITAASLLDQTMKPKMVILWLAEEQFPDKQLPRNLTRLRKRGLSICFCDDLKPHKKYYYTFIKYNKHCVVTADDDMLYPRHHLESLWKGHIEYPNSVISHQTRFIKAKNAVFSPYVEWDEKVEENPSISLLPIGCNGVLYPPDSCDTDLFDKDKIKELVLYTDDLWLKCMEVRNGTSVFKCGNNSFPYFNTIGSMKASLWKNNMDGEQRNDKAWDRLMQSYPDVRDTILSSIDNNKEL